MTVDALDAQIRETFANLTRWGEMAKQGFAPGVGSPLESDEQVFQWLPTSDIAWQALCAAQDHLKGFRAWVLANDATDPEARPGLFPIATFSLLRGALVGGAIASWVLASDDVDVRTGRSLSVASDWYENHLRWARTMRQFALDSAEHETRLKHVEARAKEVQELRRTRTPKGRLKTTDVVVQANAEIWPDDHNRAVATKGLWQAGSGDAHALGWSILTRGYELTPLDSAMGQFVGSLSRAGFSGGSELTRRR